MTESAKVPVFYGRLTALSRRRHEVRQGVPASMASDIGPNWCDRQRNEMGARVTGDFKAHFAAPISRGTTAVLNRGDAAMNQGAIHTSVGDRPSIAVRCEVLLYPDGFTTDIEGDF